MEWLAQNWLWLTLIGVFIGMHVFGHGCCGKHNKDKGNTEDH